MSVFRCLVNLFCYVYCVCVIVHYAILLLNLELISSNRGLINRVQGPGFETLGYFM